MKLTPPDLSKLQALRNRRADLNAASADCSRRLIEQEQLNQRLLDDAKLGDDSDVAELAHGRTVADILRAKLPRIEEQLVALDAELLAEARAQALAGERYSAALLQTHRVDVERAVEPFVPRVRIEKMAVTNHQTGNLAVKDYQSARAFEAVVEAVLFESEYAIAIRKSTPRVTFSDAADTAAANVVASVQGLAALAKKFSAAA